MKASLVACVLFVSGAFSHAVPMSYIHKHNLLRTRQNTGAAPDIPTSPDGTCSDTGGRPADKVYRCGPGYCCSEFGYCGDGDDFCLAKGCQPNYGRCGPKTKGNDTIPTPRPTTIPTVPRDLSISKVPFGETLVNCTQPGHIALTFDDGPYNYTMQLLDYLAVQRIKATFFINGYNFGQNVDDFPYKQHAIRRMFAEGHQVASHTYSHPDLNSYVGRFGNETNDALAIQDEMVRLEELTYKLTYGSFRYPTYMRPPFFSCTLSECKAVMKNMGYHMINAAIDTLDYEGNVTQSVGIFRDAINARTSQNDSLLVLMHDVYLKTVVDILPQVIKLARNKGFSFSTVGKCMGEEKSRWYRKHI